jgi:uncharacterized membrane protein YebE (DUF533 family)
VLNRILLAATIGLLAAFVFIVLTVGNEEGTNAIIVFVTIAVLVAAGSLVYGRNSHYAAAQARMRPPVDPPDQLDPLDQVDPQHTDPDAERDVT